MVNAVTKTLSSHDSEWVRRKRASCGSTRNGLEGRMDRGVDGVELPVWARSCRIPPWQLADPMMKGRTTFKETMTRVRIWNFEDLGM